MAKDRVAANSYEEARQRRLEENMKRFEELSILKISKSLSADKPKSVNTPQRRHVKPKTIDTSVEPRRSSRARNPVSTYREEVDISLPSLRKRSRSRLPSASYLARPVDEIRMASYEERAKAFEIAQELQSNLQSRNPSFVKSMVRSHVYSCFWLALPTSFCVDHLPKDTAFDMVLEDEDGNEYEATYIAKRTGLSGGWRAFALEHKLDDGDALVFELVDPARFKIYITRVSQPVTKLQKKEETKEVGEGSQKKQAKQQSIKEMMPSKKKNGLNFKHSPDSESKEEKTGGQKQRRSSRLNK